MLALCINSLYGKYRNKMLWTTKAKKNIHLNKTKDKQYIFKLNIN